MRAREIHAEMRTPRPSRFKGTCPSGTKARDTNDDHDCSNPPPGPPGSSAGSSDKDKKNCNEQGCCRPTCGGASKKADCKSPQVGVRASQNRLLTTIASLTIAPETLLLEKSKKHEWVVRAGTEIDRGLR